MPKHEEASVDQIMDGLTGDYRLGQRYYVFTVTYHYIGRIAKLGEHCMTLDDVTIVMSAGDSSDAVTKIVQGKAKPQVCENPGKPVMITYQSIVSLIPF